MPLDAVCLAALTAELRPALEGARIDKIQQPERDMLLLSVRCAGENRRLLISAGSGNARVHFTDVSFENPTEPPMFCMLMRKHLVGARIVSLVQPCFERMLKFELETHDELGDNTKKSLIIELIGRSSNVVLVGADGIIIDCMRRIGYAGDELRRLLPGMLYRMPPKQTKPCFFETAAETRKEIIAAADSSKPVDKWLLDSFSALSPLVCRELAARCAGKFDTLPEQLDALCETVASGDFVPYMALENSVPREFCFMPLSQYGNKLEGERFASFSELLDAFYSRRDRHEQQRRKGKELTHSVKTARDRIARKLASQGEELKRTDDREQVRKLAELVTANLYRMKKGDRVLVCQDYYLPDSPETRIELDPLKTPQQNAAALYREYGKLKAAREHLTVLIEQGERQLDYLNSVLDELSRTESEKDLADIRRELRETGYLRAQKNSKSERVKPQAPLRFLSDDGLEILVGRSNMQNDELTLKTARRTDMWLHTQKVHGSHVILRCDGLEPPKRSIEQAAALAAYYSQARDGGKTPVDFTMVKNVRKPSGSLPGMVIYTQYSTVIAEADEALAVRLKK